MLDLSTDQCLSTLEIIICSQKRYLQNATIFLLSVFYVDPVRNLQLTYGSFLHSLHCAGALTKRA